MTHTASNIQPFPIETALAPHSVEAEEAVIGATLTNPAQYPKVAAFLKHDDFFLLRHNYIWQAFERLVEREDPIDPLTVSEELSNMKKLSDIGGTAYLLKLITETPTSVYAEVYGRIVGHTALRRAMLEANDKIRSLIYDEDQNIKTVVEQSQVLLQEVSRPVIEHDHVPLHEVLSEHYDNMETLLAGETSVGIPSGFRDLDKLLGGFQKSDLLMFAGRPGMGKTSWMLTIALHAARLGAKVAINSLEMGRQQIADRLIAMETGVSVQDLRLGNLDDAQKSRYVEAVGRMSKMHIFIDESPTLTPAQLRSRCKRIQHEYGLDMVILDYVQLMSVEGQGYSDNRVGELSYITRALKELARELHVPLISGAQLSRAVEQRKDKRPMLSDLRDSGTLEQDSDIVMFLYRDEVYNPHTDTPGQADVIVAKHRNGPTGTASMYFEKQLTKFLDVGARRAYGVARPK